MGGRAATVNDDRVDERHLIERAQADPTCFARLYEDNLPALFGHVLRRCGSRSRAEDVTSEVFLRALRSLPRFEWRGVPYIAYLRRIADNVLVDAAGRDSKDSALPWPADEPVPDATGATDADEELLALVAALPDDQRLVLALRFAEDQSTAQVAAALGRSEGAVKQLQHRALSTLRAALAAQPREDS